MERSSTVLEPGWWQQLVPHLQTQGNCGSWKVIARLECTRAGSYLETRLVNAWRQLAQRLTAWLVPQSHFTQCRDLVTRLRRKPSSLKWWCQDGRRADTPVRASQRHRRERTVFSLRQPLALRDGKCRLHRHTRAGVVEGAVVSRPRRGTAARRWDWNATNIRRGLQRATYGEY